MTGAVGALPSSEALSEASLDSLQELMARDPESYQQQDLDRIILEMRKLRERLEAADAAGTRPKAARVAKPQLSAPINPQDFGI